MSRPALARPLALVVLAAGKGTRLALGNEGPPKVLLACLGAPLLEHVRRATLPLAASRTVVVVGHQAERVEAWLEAAWPEAASVRQVPQEGTGQAVRLALESIPDFSGDVVVVYGDVPQVRASDLALVLETHAREGNAATVLTGHAADAGALGRIVRDREGRFREIVEARDAADRPEVLAIREFNTGFYAFDAASLRPVLAGLSKANRQGEEYLTEAPNLLAAAGRKVGTVLAEDPGALLGVNSFADLAQAHTALRRRVAGEHMARGVHVVDPETTVIEIDVEIGPGAQVLPFCHIGRGCRIGPKAVVGPFARLRANTVLDEGAEVGNFVEVKKSHLAAYAKAKHLAYLGDASVGPRANIGCGTITANYDGRLKHPTTIGARSRIGSGTVLVAPVTVGDDAVTGAGAVVLAGHDVPAGRTAVGVPARVLARDDSHTEEAASGPASGAESRSAEGKSP